MNAGRIAALFFWGLAHTVLAAEEKDKEETENLSNYSAGLLQARLSAEQKRLEAVEAELTLLRGELQKARARQAEVRAQQFDSARVSAALTKFQRSFAAVSDAVARSALPTLSSYKLLEQSAQEMSRVTTKVMDDSLPQYTSEEHRTEIQEEIYGNPRSTDLPSRTELEVLKLPKSPTDGSVSAEEFQAQMKEVVGANAERVKALSMGALERLFTQDRETAVKAWEEILTRAQASIAVREKQAKGIQATIDGLSIELEARQRTEIENDVRMNWAVIMMIGALALLFLATRFFSPEVQLVIFHQRTLVEMMGMAFLLLTIIILGTSGKIETSVLGTLLGTVGGYIFGQQVQARRNTARDEPESKPGTAPEKQPVTRKELQDIVQDLQRMVRQAPPEMTPSGTSQPPGSKPAESARSENPAAPTTDASTKS